MNDMVTIAAIDLGATSGRVVAGRFQRDDPDSLTMEVIHRFDNRPVRLHDGLHWNIVGLYQNVIEGLRLLAVTDTISSIGIDSWAVDYGLFRDGRILGEPYHYRDQRTDVGVERVHTVRCHAALYPVNGLQFLPFNTLYQLAAEDSAVVNMADRLLLIPDLIAYWLTGVQRSEYTNASTTGLLDATTGEWSDELISELGFPRDLFADLIQPGKTIGKLSSEVALEIGVSETVPVVAVATHDTASAVIGTPRATPSAAYISCGTWGLVGLELDAPVLSDKSRVANFTNEAGADGTIRFLRNEMGMWMLNESISYWSRRDGEVELTEVLTAAAELPTPATIDVSDPRFAVPGEMPHRIAEVCRENNLPVPKHPAEFVRLIIESLAMAYVTAVDTAGALANQPVDAINISGGGSLNTLLVERLQELAGVPVHAGPAEATARGNLVVQIAALHSKYR